MRVPLSKIGHHLFRPNPKVDIRYLENNTDGSIKTTEFLTGDAADELDETGREKHREFIRDINDDVLKQMRQASFYRYFSIAVILLFLVLPTVILAFLGSGNFAILFGIYYAFFTYLLVEAYIQASRNYFEDRLYEKFQTEYLE